MFILDTSASAILWLPFLQVLAVKTGGRLYKVGLGLEPIHIVLQLH